MVLLTTQLVNCKTSKTVTSLHCWATTKEQHNTTHLATSYLEAFQNLTHKQAVPCEILNGVAEESSLTRCDATSLRQQQFLMF